MQIRLLRASGEHLAAYADALKRGWSPDNLEDGRRLEELDAIARDPNAFLAKFDDREAKGPRIRLPDGSLMSRLPGFVRWIWDGEFAGSIGLRWQPGTAALPPTCLGHIGYTVVPWKRRRGYATEALRLILPEARKEGLPYVEIVTDLDNVASQRVILANGGFLIERFRSLPAYGSVEKLRFHITLNVSP
jgi:predicted acetyltransferase